MFLYLRICTLRSLLLRARACIYLIDYTWTSWSIQWTKSIFSCLLPLSFVVPPPLPRQLPLISFAIVSMIYFNPLRRKNSHSEYLKYFEIFDTGVFDVLCVYNCSEIIWNVWMIGFVRGILLLLCWCELIFWFCACAAVVMSKPPVLIKNIFRTAHRKWHRRNN